MEAIRFCHPERKLDAVEPEVAEELVSVEALPKTPLGVVASPCPFPDTLPNVLPSPAPDTDAAPVVIPTAECPAEVISNPAAAFMPD